MSLLFQVYDTQSGTQLAQLSGSYTNHAVYSQSNQIHIVFTTDGSVTASGWNVTWTKSESILTYLDILSENLFMLSLTEFAWALQNNAL